MDSSLIYDRGRGPELRRIRITVYNLIPYLESGRFTDTEILECLPITAEELTALKQYIADHYTEVMAVHQQIEERIRKGIEAQDTPEFRAWRARIRADMELYKVWLQERDPSTVSPDPDERMRAFHEWLTARKTSTARSS